MENVSYSSYPDSSNSSPRSRDIDDSQSWEEQPPPNYRVKFMCSYGGKIQPRPHDYQLAYVGGETKILAVDRNVKFPFIISKLAALCGADSVSDFIFKYQLPGEDLDALISVTNDEDLEHMMIEYDRLYRNSAKPARLRLFLFRSRPPTMAGNFGSDEAKPDRQWFVDALNSVQVQNLDVSSPPASAAVLARNPDLLFGMEKGFPAVPATKFIDTAPAPPTVPELVVAAGSGDRLWTGDTVVNQLNLEEKISPPTAPLPIQIPFPVAFLPERHMTSTGASASAYPVATAGAEQQPVYLIPTAGSVYQHPPLRPVTGQVGQSYYGVQRVAQEVYREQPMYTAVPATAAASSAQQQQQPPKLGVYGEGIGMVQPPKVGMTEQGYMVGYDSAGRQIYFPAPYAAAPARVSTVDGKQGGGGGALNQDGM